MGNCINNSCSCSYFHWRNHLLVLSKKKNASNVTKECSSKCSSYQAQAYQAQAQAYQAQAQMNQQLQAQAQAQAYQAQMNAPQNYPQQNYQTPINSNDVGYSSKAVM